jgi:hypothetical protein
LADSPEISVAFTADVDALQAGMQQAESMVNGAARSMAEAPARAGIWQRFDAVFAKINQSSKRAMNAVTVATVGASAAAGDFQGVLNALPGGMGAVAGSAFQLGGALHEMFTGAKAEAAALVKEVETLNLRSGLKADTRAVERQVGIEKELDPLRKIELQRQHELAEVRAEVLKMQGEGATQEQVSLAAAKERLVNARAENAIREHNQQLAEKQKDADEKAAKEAQAKAEQYQKAFDAAHREYDIARASLDILNEQDEVRAIELKRDMDLNLLWRERKELAASIGDIAADQLLTAKEALVTAEAQKAIDAERQKQAEESMKQELAATKELLASTKLPTALTGSVQASVGGAFTFANSAAANKYQDAMVRQADLTAKIKELVARIEASVRGGASPAIT